MCSSDLFPSHDRFAVLPSYYDPSHSSNNVLAYSSGANPSFGLIENGASTTNVTVSNSSNALRYSTLNTDLSALSIRATEYLQRWKEVVQFSSRTIQIKWLLSLVLMLLNIWVTMLIILVVGPVLLTSMR